ncbi:MAG: hypothetical protein ACKO6L_09605 [Flavobacteriales bacterium]
MENFDKNQSQEVEIRLDVPRVPTSFRAKYYIQQGFSLFKEDAAAYVALTVLFLFGTFILGFIPYLGDLLPAFVAGPLMVGFAIYAMASERNEYRSSRTFFQEFESKSVFQYFFYNYCSKLMSTLLIIGAIYLFIGQDLPALLEQFENMNKLDEEEALALLEQLIHYGPLQLGLLAGVVLMALFNILITFSLFYIWRSRMTFLQAIGASAQFVLRNFGGVFLLLLLMGLLAVLSALTFFLGMLILIPVFQLSLYRAFRDFHPELFDPSL